MEAAPTLRPMTAEDLDEVVAVEAAAGGLHWSRSMFAAELERPDSRVWIVADADAGADAERIVGYVGVILLVDEAHVANVAVLPEARRQGVATRLLEEGLEQARRRGATAATLEVRPSNAAARALYRRLGFAPVGTRRGYYADTGEDAIVMWRHDLADGVPRHVEGR